MGKLKRMIAALFNRQYDEPKREDDFDYLTNGYTDEEVSAVALRLIDTNRYHVPMYFSDVKTCDLTLERIAKERVIFESHPNLRMAKALKSWFDFYVRRTKEAKKQAHKDQRIKELEQQFKKITL